MMISPRFLPQISDLAGADQYSHTTIHYGATGRPVDRYRLVAEQYSLLKQYSQ